MLDKFEVVFVVLVYRNTEDLTCFFKNLPSFNSKVIVVNSYFDDKTEEEFHAIAIDNNADFISVPNKGYGAGNNRGCEYALAHYTFNYLIISNADIEIKDFSLEELNSQRITAPLIKNKKGKLQNPAKPYQIPIIDKFMYHNYRNNSRNGIWICCALNKIIRIIFYVLNTLFGFKKIYEPHGSFFIIPYDILTKMYPLFNESMFLFAEEDHLARLAKTNGIEVEYNKCIKVYHKEDGSVGLINQSQFDITKDSFITYYEYWRDYENS